ncbi:facilitated trehalose transporter Tret1-like [Aricia agestis]|uniref:facilitated trehalose transporter Tret1-like n=1 Tax=Aricia agestis TaxID=91739 RepID=UPI001C20BE0E|nr:facilitated trehalose transporter Tret1-like [Aricia agestis]
MVHKFHINEIGGSSRIKSVASQVLAAMSSYLLLLDLGMAIAFPTISVPELLNAKEGLSLNDVEASWFGSISFLTQPIGAILSGPIVDYFGRKKASFLVNIPHLVGWTLMHFAWSTPSLFMSNALLGFGTGIMEAPINAYVGEISEPSVRGALCTSTQMFASIGIFVIYFFGTVLTWRQAALLCLAAPLASMLMVLVAPETPVWLLVHGREKEALKSLCRLRGWTTPEHVKEEYESLSVYCKKLQECVICSSTGQDVNACEHDKMNYFKRALLKSKYVMFCKETMRPMYLVMMYFLFYVMSGLTPIRPNMANVCGAFGMAQDGKQIVLWVGIITFITSIISVVLIKLLGKRKLCISSLFTTGLACALLSAYAKNHIADSVFSYDTSTFPTQTSVTPLVYFYLLTIFTGFSVPWVFLGEVFPFRCRATAQGFAAASYYVFTFVGSKTFIDIEQGFKLWGTFATYAGFSFVGTIYLYFFLPETENKTLQEIEEFYSGEFRTFADDPVINMVKRKR